MSKSKLEQEDLSQSLEVLTSTGKAVFVEGILLRRIPALLSKSGQETIVNIPVLYEPTSGKILKETIPEAIRTDYQHLWA